MKTKHLLLIFSLLFFAVQVGFGQLSAGDIAFLQYNGDGTSTTIKFVALVDIPAGEIIHFTDNGWKSVGSFRSGEGTDDWTCQAGGISCGTIVSFTETNMALSTSGDQILAYQGSSSSPTFIAAIQMNGTWDADATDTKTSALPTGLTDGTNCISISPEVDNGKYDDSGSPFSDTKANLLASINNSANWVVNNSTQQTFSGTFTVTDCGGSSNDNDSQVSTSSTLTEPLTISSTVTAANGIQVFDFTFTDLASGDMLATIIDQLQITQGSANGVADWTNAIAGAVLNGPDQINMIGTINATNITFASNNMISIADGTNETYTLSIWLKTDLSAISDNDILEFAMNYTNITEDATGSTFGSGAPESGDANVAIDIATTQLLFVQQPSTTNVSAAMSPDPTVKACDANGNIDVDYSTAISVSSDGTMTGNPVAGTWNNGVATFSGLTHTVVGTGLTLTASSGVLADENSITFDIIDQCMSELIISEYVEGSSNNKFIEIYNGTGVGVDLTNYDLVQYNNGSSTVTYTLDLGTSILADGSTFVVAKNTQSLGVSADLSTPSNVMNFNGNDVMALQKSGVNVDIIGKIGEDPGTEWGTGGTTTAEHTLIRFSSITAGDTDGSNAFDPATEWTGYAQDYVADLGSHTTDCNCIEPTTHSSSLLFSNITNNSMDLNWTSGNGAHRIVVAKLGAPVDWNPTNGTTYSANSDFSSAFDAGNGNKILYSSGGNSLSVTGLQGGSTYYFKIFEFNCGSGNENYLVDEFVLSGNETTLLSNVQNLSASCITETTATLTWDAPSGSYEGILVTVRAGATPVNPSCDGAGLTTPNTDFSTAGAANEYCGNGLNSYYVYNGTGNTVTITGLTNGSSYTFKVFTYNGSSWSNGTLTTKTIDLLDVTNENAGRGNGEVQVSWSNPTNCYDEIMIVGKDNTTYGAITAVPSGLTPYTASSIFGGGGSGANLPANEFCVFKSTTGESNVTVSGLTNGNDYCFKIFVRNGTEWSDGVTVCQIPLDISIIEPGDLMIVAVNTNYPAIGEEFTFVCFQDIKVGTPIDFTENGWEREYPNKWGTTEGTIRLTRTGGGDLPAGTTVTVIMNGTNGKVDADFDIYVAGTDELPAYWSITELNTTNGSGFNLNPADDIWIMQNGSWIENLTGSAPTFHDDDYTGNVLYGWTATGWGVGTGTELSDLYPYCDCFNTDVSGIANNSKVKYTGLMTTATKLEWISRVNNELNWTGYADDASYDAATPQYRQSGATFPITAGGYVDGVWTGSQNTDWFDCGNWQSLTVPDETIDVTVGVKASKNVVIDDASTEASKYGSIAKCKDLTISNQELHIAGDNTDVLEVHGNFLLNSGGKFDMSDNSQHGLLYLYGNWDNQATVSDFIEGQGTVYLVGDATQTISTNSFTEVFYNLTSNNTFASGITLNNSIRIDGQLSHSDGEINLNGNDIELRGIYSRSTGTFIGNATSDFLFSNSGSIADLMFINNTNLHNFTMNRAGQNATILSDLSIANNLTITAGSVTLSAGKNYDAGTIINTPNSAAALILKSDACGTASLIQQTGAVPATCERFFTSSSWHYYFTPLSNANIDILTTTAAGEDNPNFYFYDEAPADFWQGTTLYNPTGWTAPAHTGKLLNDRGYIHQSPEARIYSLSGGNLDDADHSFTLSYTNSGTGNEPTTGTDWDEFEGWNLIGNPYASALNWETVWTNLSATEQTYLENGIYYFDPTQSKYVYYGAATMNNLGITINGTATIDNKFIPANQGFFVKATPAGHGNSISIDKNARAHNDQQFWKGGNKEITQNLVRLNIEKDGYTDETVIRTDKFATDEKDYSLDAYKMFAWDNSKPQIYTTNNEFTRSYVLNSIAPFESHKTVPVAVSIGVAGEYTINMTEYTFVNKNVYLEDKEIGGEYVNLQANPNYEFTADAGTYNDRFVLHFNKNNSPVLLSTIDAQVTDEDVAYSLDLHNIFEDSDLGDVLSYSITRLDGSPAPEWLVANNETISGTPRNEDVGTITLKYVASDLCNATASTEFTITVNNVNDAPIVVNPIRNQNTFEDGFFTLSLDDVFTDIDENDVLTYEISLSDDTNLPSWLTYNSAEKTISGTPTNDDLGTYTLKYQATDLALATTIDEFTIIVNNVNDAPFIVNQISNQIATEDIAYNLSLTDIFEDVDAGDELTYSISNLPSWLVYNSIEKSLSGTPTNEDVASSTIEYTATDLAGAETTCTFNFVVENVNDAPIVVNQVENQTATEEIPFNLSLANIFEDVDLGDELNYSISLSNGNELPSWLTYNPTDKSLSGTPQNNDVDIISINFVATDLSNEATTCNFDLTILNVNDAPTLENPIEDVSIFKNEEWSFTFAENVFEDIDLDDNLSYSAKLSDGNELPDWLYFNEISRTFEGTPTDENEIEIELTATDIHDVFVKDIFSVTVLSAISIDDIEQKYLVYPNPTTGKINLIFSQSMNENPIVKVYSPNGQILFDETLTTKFKQIDLSKYAKGIYLITIQYDSVISQEKIILK